MPCSRSISSFLLILGLVACASVGSVPDDESKRLLPAGPVVGTLGAYGSHVWRGLPYAQPPVGALRWRAPRPAERFTELLEAKHTGQACPQYASVFAGFDRDQEGPVGGEDCLYLDVYAPRFAPGDVPSADAALPVMFWIHGGGNTIGRAGFFDGGNLAQSQRVVVVAINYRLGPLGWFRHAALRAESSDLLDRSGNFGTLDMQRALAWVQENIAGFGGDPANVTIFGESAGGRDVLSLLLSPRSEGLFHRAIIQSGSTTLMEASKAEDFHEPRGEGHRFSSNEVLLRLLELEGSDPESARARLDGMTPKQIAAYLRGKSPEQLLGAYATDEYEGLVDVPNLFRDGYVLPDDEPLALIERGGYHQVPVMLGSNRDENKIFMLFDPELVTWLFGAIPRARNPDHYQAMAEHQANAWKANGVDVPAASMQRTQGDSVFAYRWDWDEEPGVLWLYDGSEMIGAAHGLEIAFVFGHFDLGPDSGMLFDRGNREGRELLSSQMMSYWAEFAYSGDPGRGREGQLPLWRAWDGSDKRTPKFMVLDTPAGSGEQGQGLRMDTRVQSLDSVVAAVVADPRLASDRDKCGVLRNLANWEDISEAEYASAGSGLCEAYSLESHPWPETPRDSGLGES